MARRIQRRLRHFQQDAVLRVHPFGFARGDVEMLGIKHIGIRHHTACIDKAILALRQINIQLFGRELRNHLAPGHQPIPKLFRRTRAGKLARQADDGNQTRARAVYIRGKRHRSRRLGRLAQMGGHCGNGGVQEKIGNRKRPVQRRLQAVMQPRHMQGRCPKIKEIGASVQIIRVHAKGCGQLARNHLLKTMAAGPGFCGGLGGLGRLWQNQRLQRAPVDLAIAVQRQGWQGDKPRRDRIIGQTRGKACAQSRLIQGPACHAVRHQHLVSPVRTAVRHHHRLCDISLRLQRRLNLAQFNPEATDFHLSVNPAQIVHHAARVLPGQIAGAVQHHARIPRGGDKFFRRHIRLAQIAQCQPLTRRKQFARLAHRHGLQIWPQHKHIGAADGFANRQRQPQFRLGARNGMATGEGGVFRRAVTVDDRQVRARRHHAGHARRRHHVAPGQQLAQGGKIAGPRIGHGMKQPRRQPHRGDTLIPDHCPKRAKRPRCIFRQHQRATVQQRAPDLQR